MILKKRLFLLLSVMLLFSIVSPMHSSGSEKKEMTAVWVARVAIRGSVLLGAMVIANRAWDCFITNPFKERYEEVSPYYDNAKYWEAGETTLKCLKFILNGYFAKKALSKSFWR